MARLVDVATQVAAAGIDELAIADTIGVAVPRDVQRRLSAVSDAVEVPLRVHVHNTRNTGYASALAAADAGVSVLDASLGGIGGCPFAPRATGNIATEDLVFALRALRVRHRSRPRRTVPGQRLAGRATGTTDAGPGGEGGRFPPARHTGKDRAPGKG